MRSCPRCTFPLTPYTHEGEELDHCQRCEGTFVDHGLAAVQFGPEAHPEFWKQEYVTKGPVPSKLLCPRCQQRLDAYELKLDKTALEIDECGKCHSMWFDRDEAVHLRALMQNSAIHAAAMTARKGTVKSYIFQLLTQFPVEVWNPVRHRPYMVYTLLTSLVVMFLWQLDNEPYLVQHHQQFLMVPADMMAGENLWTLVSAGFFHGGLMHLVGNMWMLWIFGDNVEDQLRKRHFLILYFGALLVGNVAHLVAEWGSIVPLLGASGAISGLMGAYLVLFPRVKVWAMIVVFRVKVSAIWYLGLWGALQVGMVYLEVAGVAWFAHLGGFAFGALYALAIRKRMRKALLGTHEV